MQRTDVLIVGAGPVGMTAALLASKSGLSVRIIERNQLRKANSRAIGITPPTLEILAAVGLDKVFVDKGVRVEKASGNSKKACLGKLELKIIDSEYRYILAIPQDMTEAILEQALSADSKIQCHLGLEALDYTEDDGGIKIQAQDCSGNKVEYEAKYIMACDGGKSRMREAAGINFEGAPYHDTFLMGDYEDKTGWGESARLYFTPRGSIESFPMPGGKRRFVLSTREFLKENTTDFLEREIPLRSTVSVKDVKKYWESGFGVQHFLARSFVKGRLFLCGDAAHLMSPIGGQNMNCGFADAELAVWLICRLLEGKTTQVKASRVYNKARRRSARSATGRAWLMMRLGTTGGFLWNLARNTFALLMLHTPLLAVFVPMFCMQSLPDRNLKACKRRYEKEL